MTDDCDLTIAQVLKNKLYELGIYDRERCDELVSRIEKNEDKMLILLGRISVEDARGGSKVEQGLRALIRSSEVKSALATFSSIQSDELSDPSFPMVSPKSSRRKTKKTTGRKKSSAKKKTTKKK